MTRSITAVWTAALCAIAVAVAQPVASAHGQTTSTKPKAPAKTGAPAKISTPTKAATAAKSAPAKTSTPATASAPAQRASAASLTGCLHADGDKFKLSELEGTQAPKGRSWKTGFIVKTTKDVEVVGASSSVNLGDQIGRKVTITGTRDGERHFKAQSVKQVSPVCS